MTSTSQSGLGFIDAKKTYVEISIDIPVRSKPRDPRDKKRHRTKLQQHHDTRMRDLEQKLHSFRHIQVEIQQDLGGLHHRAGDTGSVVWRARSVVMNMPKASNSWLTLGLRKRRVFPFRADPGV